jgi:hypothetical protein
MFKQQGERANKVGVLMDPYVVFEMSFSTIVAARITFVVSG